MEARLFTVDELGARYSADGMTLISVPKDLTTYKVLDGTHEISEKAFKDSIIEEVVLPDTITSIGNSVFSGCKSLRNINLPLSIREIGYDAFYDCASLKAIWLPECIDEIRIDTFKGCRSLEKVYIPSGIKCIGLGAFQGCSSLRSVVIPALCIIESYAFSGCTALSQIQLPILINKICGEEFGEEVFGRCTSLKSVDYWYDYIPSRTFAGCSSLEYLKIGARIGMVETDAFYFCDSLRKIEFKFAPHPKFDDFENFYKWKDNKEIEFVIPEGTEESFIKLFELAHENPNIRITVKSDNQKQSEIEEEDSLIQ